MSAATNRWVILVGGGYGAFFFEGDAEQAEEVRVHKARWEGAIARKRPAADDEHDGKVSQCWNHPLFSGSGGKYACRCGECTP